jgi:methylenetetrahydrofolate--tRNA-(uracil-5-)-methyltransferase
MRAADASRVPAGAALAVDRERFAQTVTDAIHGHPLITVAREEITSIPTDPAMYPLIIATGPLTSESLSADVAALVGAEHLYFYDAISPIVLAESLDMSKVFRASRWGRSLRGRDSGGSQDPPLPERRGGPSGPPEVACGIDDGEGEYLKCPLTEEEYGRF